MPRWRLVRLVRLRGARPNSCISPRDDVCARVHNAATEAPEGWSVSFDAPSVERHRGDPEQLGGFRRGEEAGRVNGLDACAETFSLSHTDSIRLAISENALMEVC